MPKYWWVGQRGYDCLAFGLFLPIEGIICCDDGYDLLALESQFGISIFSLERQIKNRKKWSNYFIEDSIDLFVSSTLNSSICDDVFILYRPSKKLLNNITPMTLILSPKIEVAEYFDDKFLTFSIISNLGIDQIKGFITNLEHKEYSDLCKILGKKIVIKQKQGSSGINCFIINNLHEYNLVRNQLGVEDVLVTEFVEGNSYNVHLLILDETILISALSIQLIGIRECTEKKEVYCGNDFASASKLSTRLIQNIQKQAQKIGEWMKREGYRGILGIDFIGTDDNLFPIDINPRLQGSTCLLTQLEINAGRKPLTQIYVEQTLKLVEEIGLPFISQTNDILNGAQIILHSMNTEQVKITQSLRPGVYSFFGETINFKTPSILLSDCLSDNEFLIISGVPIEGTKIDPGSPILKLFFNRQVLDLSNSTLLPEISIIVKKIQNSIKYSNN